jgi:hypothetical protein
MLHVNRKATPEVAVPAAYVELMGRLARDLSAVPAHMGPRFLEVGSVSIGLQRSDGDEYSGVVRRSGVVRTFTSYEKLLEYLRQHSVDA